MIGTILRHRYKIIEEIKQGGFGVTYKAIDLDLPDDHLCVVKHLRPKDPSSQVFEKAKVLFHKEAQALYRLGKHEQIPQLYARFFEGGEFYLVQEYIEGHDLSKEIIQNHPLTETETIKLLKEILEVLSFVHLENIIHCDLKPSNLMRRKKDGKLILIDFGAVKTLSTLQSTATGETTISFAIGSLGYMPPEQSLNKPKLASDIYAVGMIAIEAITGLKHQDLPPDSQTDKPMWQCTTEGVSDKLAEILNKMIAYEAHQRYQNASLALAALNTLTGVSKPSATFFSSYKFETVKVNSQGTIISRETKQAQYFKEDLGQDVILEMVYIPGGEFLMGSPTTEKARFSPEGMPRLVKVSPFFMSKYPVTQSQWQIIMNYNPSNFQGGKRPVESVSWLDSLRFCKILSQKTKKNYRLPTVVEWEYACRAGTTTPFYFGETITSDLANYKGNDVYRSEPKGINRSETTEVGQFPANGFGLYDLHGNVWEWCDIVTTELPKEGFTDNSPWSFLERVNFLSLGDKLYVKGGAWVNEPDACRCARLPWYAADFSGNFIGLRVACVLENEPT